MVGRGALFDEVAGESHVDPGEAHLGSAKALWQARGRLASMFGSMAGARGWRRDGTRAGWEARPHEHWLLLSSDGPPG